MRLFLSLLALFFLAYYIIICIYTRKWNSTFAIFWLSSGTAFTGLSILWGAFPVIIEVFATVCMILALISFVFIEYRIVRGMFDARDRIPEYLVVLGAQVRGVYITNSLKRRLDKAYEVWKEHPQITVIVSGGQGKGEDISEADAMAEYLLKKGIKKEQIRKECRSTSTRENLDFCKRIADVECSPTAVVTNNFHIYRALLYAKSEGYKDVWGISARTNPVLFLNYLVREYFAVCYLYLTL